MGNISTFFIAFTCITQALCYAMRLGVGSSSAPASMPVGRDAVNRSMPAGGRQCGVQAESATENFLHAAKLLHMVDSNVEPLAKHLMRRAGPIVVNTYFHIISDRWLVAKVTTAMINDQLSTLNSAYSTVGIQFNLLGVDFTQNDAWAVAAGNDMQAAKSALRKGSYADLNIYFHTNLTNDILGTCTLPAQLPASASTNRAVYSPDGCNIAVGSMPNGDIYGYNLGKTAVHEVGHWFGLLHTFEGYSCNGPGDYISDTKQESASTDGCPTTPAKNSCPAVGAAADPIHNYMDYSSDACYTGFSPMQGQRMLNMWQLYRSGK